MNRVVSGGQTGADRAGLDAALELGFPCGGFCPKGRLAEDGVIPRLYPLVEIEGGYRQRTKRNLLESSGTAIFYDQDLSGGTKLTLSLSIKHRRPYLLLDMCDFSVESAVEHLNEFTGEAGFQSLNVAGPRYSSCPQIYDFVNDSIRRLIFCVRNR